MGSIGSMEILLVFVIALLLFGPKKLPELGRSLGKTIREFKKASSELRDTLEREVDEVKRTEDEARGKTGPKDIDGAAGKGSNGPDSGP